MFIARPLRLSCCASRMIKKQCREIGKAWAGFIVTHVDHSVEATYLHLDASHNFVSSQTIAICKPGIALRAGWYRVIHKNLFSPTNAGGHVKCIYHCQVAVWQCLHCILPPITITTPLISLCADEIPYFILWKGSHPHVHLEVLLILDSSPEVGCCVTSASSTGLRGRPPPRPLSAFPMSDKVITRLGSLPSRLVSDFATAILQLTSVYDMVAWN
jgi:hypothetical protein